MPRTAVIGTGTWGTAVAMLAAQRGLPDILLYGRSAEKCAGMQASRRHPLLGDRPLHDAITVTSDRSGLTAADLIFWAVPTPYTRDLARHLAHHVAATCPVVSLSKGVEFGSLMPVTGILRSLWGDERAYGCLSGPSHAVEVIAGLPVGLVIAAPEALTALVSGVLHGERCRLYTSQDVLGVEIAGALKNVVAVAAGVCDGLELGDNAKAAVVCRGLAEMRRLGRAMGALDTTFAGLAGIGDLIASCYSRHGRNRALGLAMARGEVAQDYLARQATVAEGAFTCRAAVELGQRFRVELPIASQVAFAVWSATPVTSAMENLLSRAPKEEDA